MDGSAAAGFMGCHQRKNSSSRNASSGKASCFASVACGFSAEESLSCGAAAFAERAGCAAPPRQKGSGILVLEYIRIMASVQFCCYHVYAAGKGFFTKKFSQSADKRQIVLAQIWLVICVLRERQKMSKRAATAAGSAFGALLRMARLNGRQLSTEKFSQSADKRQIVLAQIWLVICALRERQKMSKSAATAVGSAFGALLRMTRLDGRQLSTEKFSQSADKRQIVLAQIWLAICALKKRQK